MGCPHTKHNRQTQVCCLLHVWSAIQQWRSALVPVVQSNSQRAYVHARCVNGGVAHDHELHPKQPADQDAVDAVAHQRDCVTQAAADSEVPLPLAPDSDQASTAALADDEPRLLDVKRPYDWTRKPRTSSGSTRLRGITSRTFAAPRLCSHRQGSSLLDNKRSTPFSVPSHDMVHPHLHWNQRERLSCSTAGSSWDVPAVNASESNCAHFLEARLDLFWAEDWPALWAMVRAECDVTPIFSTRRRTTTEQNSHASAKWQQWLD